jgi:hypothetical protein
MAVITVHGSEVVTEKPDGSTITENTDGTWDITFPKKADGSQKIYLSDGREGSKNPDGTITFLSGSK